MSDSRERFSFVVHMPHPPSSWKILSKWMRASGARAQPVQIALYFYILLRHQLHNIFWVRRHFFTQKNINECKYACSSCDYPFHLQTSILQIRVCHKRPGLRTGQESPRVRLQKRPQSKRHSWSFGIESRCGWSIEHAETVRDFTHVWRLSKMICCSTGANQAICYYIMIPYDKNVE